MIKSIAKYESYSWSKELFNNTYQFMANYKISIAEGIKRYFTFLYFVLKYFSIKKFII